jgi:hypothetical protein
MASLQLFDMHSLLVGGYSRSTGEDEDEDEDGNEDEDDGAETKPIEFCPVIEEGVTREDLVRRVRVTEEEALQVEMYDQGTKAWHLSRRGTQTRMDGVLYSETEESKGEPFMPGRLTASNFGTAVGHNKYSSPDALIADMLWGTVVSNEAMAYGSKMEPVACRVFELAMMFITGGDTSVEHRGLMLACPALFDEESRTYEGWVGTSPDGIIKWKTQPRKDSLLEIKCPSVNKRTFYSERRDNGRHLIPHYYYDQIMGICGLQHLDDAFFVVHLPDRTQILRFMFDPDYWQELFVGMKSFWFDKYLPAALHCAKGELVKGETQVRFQKFQLEDEAVAVAKQEAIDEVHAQRGQL